MEPSITGDNQSSDAYRYSDSGKPALSCFKETPKNKTSPLNTLGFRADYRLDVA